MEGTGGAAVAAAAAAGGEGEDRLNQAVQQQLNLKQVKTRAISLFKAISRILEDFEAYGRTNTTPKWQDILGQYSMVNLELFNIVDDMKKVSKAFVVHPKNVNAENATILPVMLSSKLLPEMEAEENSKREQLLVGMQNQNLPIPTQIEKLKARLDMIAAACEGAEKVLADTRKAYCFGTRQGPIAPTLDKGQAAKIQEQENLLRAAVNAGEGLRIPPDQRQITTAPPIHLADALPGLNDPPSHDASSVTNTMYIKNTPLSSNSMPQNPMLQTSASQLLGRSAASPSAPTATTSFDNTTPSPIPYANSPRSSTNIMNTPSPQQQTPQQQPQVQQQQQQRQKLMQLPQQQQQQMLAQQQQLRQSAMQGLGQLHGHQMQFSQPLGHQQFPGRQLSSGHVQHGIGQNQLNQGNQMTRLSQFSGPANSALFSAAQTTPNTQMFGLSGNNPQRSHTSQMLSDQMFNMGGGNPGGMMPIQQQQQQHGSQAFGSMASNAQNLQSGMVTLQNTQQNHPNFSQQRQQNQQ
ncbi:hypothetical protein PHAVU_005G185100 [Phaseolus vulgaris]|uniref:mediator of RNA polymerase II transcription subunit 8 isoform X2 n=1 Tax=Phaseolus vulgaris TaxID=3885 RepID=UPI0035CC820A